MPTPRKIQMVAEIRDQMTRAEVAIAADYRGLTVAQLTKLRRALRPASAELHVMKNTLAAIAADQAGRPEFKQLLQGPTAIVFGFGDPVAPVKALLDALRAERLQVPILGGWLEGRVLDAKEVESLATLPPREQLVANVVGKLQSPLYTFAGLLQASIRNFAGLVDARIRQLEEQGAAA
ncbi:MAG: 50S ribosomal protein L10 [Chloroflexota bacterium]|jgi:large subunit ribosomal protein L10|nr:50S ribosomal protein L10 [Chloroflexota bacterium]